MLRGKVEGEMALLFDGSSVRKALKISRPLPLVSGEAHYVGGGHIFCKIRASARIFRQVRIFCYIMYRSMGYFINNSLKLSNNFLEFFCPLEFNVLSH